jgi:hypothetical protein
MPEHIDQESPPAYSQHHIISRRRMLQAMMLFLSGCAVPQTQLAATPDATAQSPHFDGAIALQHAIAQMQWAPRHPGAEGWRACGDYILSQLAALGWDAVEQPFTYKGVECRNLIGKRGNGPLLIIGAHYDSRGRADQDPDPAKRSQPVPAANDGASGIAVLLELARVLKPEELNRTIWLASFDAEDNGSGGLDGWDWIQGSTYMAANLTQIPQGMLLVDMIGDADQQLYYEGNSHHGMREGVWQVAAELGYSSFVPEQRYTMLDDHMPFVQRGIPAIDIIDFDYPYWHTTADTVDKISAASLEAVGRTVEEWLLRGAPGMPAPQTGDIKQYLPLIAHHCGCHRRALAQTQLEHSQ